MKEELTTLSLYLGEFKQKYYQPIKEAASKNDLNSIKDKAAYDKAKLISDRELFLKGFIENIEKLIEKCTIKEINESLPTKHP